MKWDIFKDYYRFSPDLLERKKERKKERKNKVRDYIKT